MRKSGFIPAALLAAAGVCGVCGAGEDIMPLVPGAFSPAEFGPDGTQLRRVSSADADAGGPNRPTLRKNIVRLTVPSPGARPEAKMRMVEALPEGPGGTLRFKPLESVPGARHADIPGLVPPEVLAVSRMQQERLPGRRAAGFSPVRMPGALALGTEELPEFDPYSVQRTGNPFKDAPGKAEAFPAAATRSQIWEGQLSANNDLRPPSTPVASGAANAAPVPRGASGLRPPSSAPAGSGASLRPLAAAERQERPITIAAITVPAQVRTQVRAQVPATDLSMPPLPELPVGAYSGSVGKARRAGVVTLPPPLPDREAARRAGEFSLLSPSKQAEIASGLSLALPPTALTEGAAVVSAKPEPIRPALAAGPSPRPGEKIIEPQTPPAAARASRARQMASRAPDIESVEAPAARRRRSSVPALSAEEFTPMRGVRVY